MSSDPAKLADKYEHTLVDELDNDEFDTTGEHAATPAGFKLIKSPHRLDSQVESTHTRAILWETSYCKLVANIKKNRKTIKRNAYQIFRFG